MRPRNCKTISALTAGALLTLIGQADAAILDARLAVDINQVFVTNVIENPVDPGLPGIPQSREIDEFKEIYLNEAGDVIAKIKFAKNSVINGAKPEGILYSPASVRDGQSTALLMNSDVDVEAIPDTYVANPPYNHRYSVNNPYRLGADSLLVQSDYNDGTKHAPNGQRLELITGLQSGSPTGKVVFDSISLTTTLVAPNVDAGSTNVIPMTNHSTVAMIPGSDEVIIVGQGTASGGGTTPELAYYSFDADSSNPTLTRMFGSGDTLNLVGGGTFVATDIAAPLSLRGDAAGLAGFSVNNPGGSSQTLYSQASNGDWFEVARTGGAFPGQPGVTVLSNNFQNPSDPYAVSNSGAVAGYLYGETGTGEFAGGIVLTDPATGQTQLVAAPSSALSDGSGRILSPYINAYQSGTIRFGLNDDVLFTGQLLNTDGTYVDAMLRYDSDTGDLTAPLFQGMTLPGTDLTLDGIGLTNTSTNETLGLTLMLVRGDNSLGERGYAVITLDADGNITPQILPEDTITLSSGDLLDLSRLRTPKGFSTTNGLSDSGHFVLNDLDHGLVVFQLDLAAPLDGDLNGDGFVGIGDLNLVLSNWNQNVTAGDPLLGDPSGDGFVGIEDLNTVLGNWNDGTSPPPAAGNIPEPATLVLLGLGGLVMLKRRGVEDGM